LSRSALLVWVGPAQDLDLRATGKKHPFRAWKWFFEAIGVRQEATLDQSEHEE